MNAPQGRPRRSSLPRTTLEALAEKYEALERLRDRRDHDLAHPPREDLRRLAQSFPGCLRELDRLTLAQIRARLGAIREALKGREEPPPEVPSETVELPEEAAWIGWISRYHQLVRHELSLRPRVLGPRSPAPPVDSGHVRGARPETGPSLRALATLAEETGLEADVLAACLFPPRR